VVFRQALTEEAGGADAGLVVVGELAEDDAPPAELADELVAELADELVAELAAEPVDVELDVVVVAPAPFRPPQPAASSVAETARTRPARTARMAGQ
jgi:hypothetical protein